MTLCQAISLVIFHPDIPDFLPSVLTGGAKWPVLSAHANTDHTAPALTETAAPNPTTPAAVGSSKINSNRERPTDGQTASTSLSANPDSDVMSVASIGGSDGDSDCVELDENSPMIPANTRDLAVPRGTSRDLAVHIIKLKKCTRSWRESSTQSHCQRYFSPTPTSSKFRSSSMPIPTHQKTFNTMAPRRRSTPSLPLCTHSQKTHWSHQPSLLHAHTSRPETSPFKRKRETYWMSASLVPYTCFMVSTRIGCTKIQETSWMEES